MDLEAYNGKDESDMAQITWHNEKRLIKDCVPYVANPRQITEKQA